MPSNHFTRRVLREPLLHFLLLAALLFVVDYVFSATQKEKIVVEQQTAQYLIQQREDLELRQLSPKERHETIDAFIEDEILYSEAYKRGLDKGDSRMRRNLILKMRGLLTGDLETPDEDVLRDYFETKRDEFTLPPTISLEQVYFSELARVPDGLLDELRGGLDARTEGDSQTRLGYTLPRRSQRDLVGTLGPDAARVILTIDDDQWHGPIESVHGVHFVRIIGREAAREATYEQIKSYLEGDWLMTEGRKAVEREVERLQENYEIIIEGVGETAQ